MFFTRDSGYSWDGHTVLPTVSCTSTDPSVAWDAAGIAYFCYQGCDPPVYGSGTHLFLATSEDGGETWSRSLVRGKYDPAGQANIDKPHMAIDTNSSSAYEGYIYIAWFGSPGASGNEIMFKRSRTGGADFDEEHDISEGIAEYYNIGVNLAVAPNGLIYASWAIHDLPVYEYDEDAIGFNRSRDGGNSFDGASRIIEIPEGMNWGSNYPTTIEPKKMRVNSCPSMAVDGRGGGSGTIYMVWPDMRNGNADVFLSRSND
ncbi:MAG TPA: hypothetical protein VNN55_08620 [bacterium]|nr:hypothetical protein [bacterium]